MSFIPFKVRSDTLLSKDLKDVSVSIPPLLVPGTEMSHKTSSFYIIEERDTKCTILGQKN